MAPETSAALAAVHSAVAAVNADAANALYVALSEFGAQLARSQRQSAVLGHAFRAMKVGCIEGCMAPHHARQLPLHEPCSGSI